MTDGLILLFLAPLGLLLYTLLDRGGQNQNSVRDRLERIRTDHALETDEVYSRSFSDRVMKPALDGIGRYLMRMAPTELVGTLEKKIIMAGRPYGLSARTWFGKIGRAHV